MRCSSNFTFISFSSFVKDERTIRRVNLQQDGFIYSFFLSKSFVPDPDFCMGDSVKVEFDYYPGSKERSASMFIHSIDLV